MLMPRMFDEDLFDNWMDFPFEREFSRRNPLYGKREKNLMKTDVRQTEDGYELDIDLPGFKKEDVSVKLENGYLTVSAARSVDENEAKDSSGYIHKERWSGSCSRSFYLGDGISKQDVKARMEDGILHLTLPKKAPELPENNLIAIEG
ncbi:MAG: Hsp20/alpha crystallin family protein [Pygmaiobacter massiliensis]|nr:Hsp20/alpha crystallin family protein [Pygmaiobacter massiliensis]